MSESAKPTKNCKTVQLGPDEVSIPDSWEVKTIEEVATQFISGGTPDSDEETYWGGSIPWTTCAVIDGPLFNGQKDFITELGLKDSSASIVPAGSILFGTRVNVANVAKTQKEIAISQDLTGIILDEEKVDPDYLAWHLLFNQSKIRERYSQGSTIQGMITSDLKSLQVLIPSLSEQRQIADILSKVEEKLEQTSDIIEETQELKRGLMQDLYSNGVKEERETRSTRIGDIPVSWEMSNIGEFAEIVSGAHVKSDLVTNDPSLTPYITGPADFTRRGIEVTKYTSSPSKFCEPGDTLVTVKGMSCGKSTFADSRICISRQLKAIRPKDDLDEKYLFYWVRYKEQLLHTLAEGTRQLGLSTSDITSFPLPLPPLEEQIKIGNILHCIDNEIEGERSHQRSLQGLKRGLMQDLLTGKVRVNAET